jgi:hypothetical protein
MLRLRKQETKMVGRLCVTNFRPHFCLFGESIPYLEISLVRCGFINEFIKEFRLWRETPSADLCMQWENNKKTNRREMERINIEGGDDR